jgi:uncharacterized protein YabN with tetrapyrrole methylase and pyrophosphatase domain
MTLLKKHKGLQNECEAFGFTWETVHQAVDQVADEVREIREALDAKESDARLQEEVGDLILAALSLGHFMGYDTERLLDQAMTKFEKRFRAFKQEAQARGYATVKGQDTAFLMELWRHAKTCK